MNNTQHTPGPWYVTHNTDGRTVISAQYAEGPSYTRICSLSQPEAHNKHDARLIAAAPDLLAALQLIHDSCFTSKLLLGHLSPLVSDSFKHKMNIARAAITRATGKE